jgi:hypothetical protein
MVNKEQLRQFLVASNQAGYAGGEEKKWVKEPNHSTTIPFAKGAWESDDNFFGGEPFGGRTVVFYEENPVWIMVYYGWVAKGAATDPVYEVLKNALGKMPEDAPFRGPREYQKNDCVYRNTWKGEVERFSGEEQITRDGQLIYKANYMGGLVDQR